MDNLASTINRLPIGTMSQTASNCAAVPEASACEQTTGTIQTVEGDIRPCPERDKLPYMSRCPSVIERWAARLKKANLGKRYYDRTPDRVRIEYVPAEFRDQIGRVVSYRDNLDEHLRDGIGLILKGPIGTLKTTAAVSILIEALTRGHDSFFVMAVGLLDDIFTIKAVSVERWAQYEHNLKEASLLIIDDLADEHSEGWVITKMSAIISQRYQNKKATIITTNKTTEELKGKYAEKVFDRLRETSIVVTFKGSSLRNSPVGLK